MATLDADDLAAIAALIDARVWTAAEREQLRHRIGIDGTATVPSVATGAKLGDVLMTQLFVNASATLEKTPVIIRGQEAEYLVLFDDTVFTTPVFISAEEGTINAKIFTGNVNGNLAGKVIGGGSSTITGEGVRPDNTTTAATATKQDEILAAITTKQPRIV